MKMRHEILSTIIFLFVFSISSCSPNNKQAASELIQTARNLVEKGDVNGAKSVLNDDLFLCLPIVCLSRAGDGSKEVYSTCFQVGLAPWLLLSRLGWSPALQSTVDKMVPNMNEVVELRKVIEQKEMEKAAVKENPISYSFIEDGIQVEVNGVVKTRNTDARTGVQLSEGETWIILSTVLKDQSNKHHQTNWRGYFRLVTKTGEALSPSIPLIITSQNGTPDFVQGNERKEMKILFRVRESDGPWKLRFSNGVEYELVF